MSNLPSPNVLTKPSLAALSFALRNPETWPEGFVWDYLRCRTCAMGLALRLGMINVAGMEEVTKAFDISHETADDIFLLANRHQPTGFFMGDITPAHVADLIDAYLEGRP